MLTCFRYDTGTISGIIAMPTWLRLFSNGYTDDEGEPALNPDDESLIVSILSAGTFLELSPQPLLLITSVVAWA